MEPRAGRSLYAGRVEAFVREASGDVFARELAARFAALHGLEAGSSEVDSWARSLPALAGALEGADLPGARILLEYRLPLCSARCDALLAGHDHAGRPRAVLVELKQWEAAGRSEIAECVSFGGRDHLHPSAQARSYAEYLRDLHGAFSGEDGEAIALSACSYLHNLPACEPTVFCAEDFDGLRREAPLYARAATERFRSFLNERLGSGEGEPIARRILEGRFRPARALLQCVAEEIERRPQWRLLDEQRIALEAALAFCRAPAEDGRPNVLLVTGGPGTGKSAIAIRLLAAAAREGRSVAYATGSKAFTTNLRGIVGKRGARLFTYFNQLGKEPDRSIDLLVCDEAHRLREHDLPFKRFVAKPGDRLQIDVLLEKAKTAVFLLDENQSIRPDEVGTVERIEARARAKGARWKRLPPLSVQFRCAGSAGFLAWIEERLELRERADLAWRREDEFDFRLFSSPEKLEDELRKQTAEGNTARIVASFCWPWSDPPDDGPLVDDVVVGSWRRPWNRKPAEMGGGKAESPERHPYTIWAQRPEGFDEVGCIYSAQGFEFDFVGVILGPDFVWDPGLARWVAHPESSRDSGIRKLAKRDPAGVLRSLRNTTRVLLSRGMKGCYLLALDPATARRLDPDG